MIATLQRRPLPSGDKENRNRPPETREHAQSNKPRQMDKSVHTSERAGQ